MKDEKRGTYSNVYTGTYMIKDHELACKHCGKKIIIKFADPKGTEKCPHCGNKDWF